MAKRLAADWERIYGHPVYYLETFVDPGRFRGTCYRASLPSPSVSPRLIQLAAR